MFYRYVGQCKFKLTKRDNKDKPLSGRNMFKWNPSFVKFDKTNLN